jgi:hypothetical protein
MVDKDAVNRVHDASDRCCRLLYTAVNGPQSRHYTVDVSPKDIPDELKAAINQGQEAIDPVIKYFRKAAGDVVKHCGVSAQCHHGCAYELASEYVAGNQTPKYQAIKQLWQECRYEFDRVKKTDNTAQDDDEAEANPTESDVAHSIDFRSMRWSGTVYSFTANQAPVVRLLYEHWQGGTPDVGDETLLFSVDPEAPPARLSTLFRNHPAWGTMIVAGGSKGTHRLSTPEA